MVEAHIMARDRRNIKLDDARTVRLRALALELGRENPRMHGVGSVSELVRDLADAYEAHGAELVQALARYLGPAER